MKTLKKVIVILILLLNSYFVNAQHIYAAAVSNNGILFGKYKTTIDSEGSIPDTISVTEAKNIFMLNAIAIEKGRSMSRIKIKDYQMTICEHGDTTILKNNTDKLSNEMVNQLQKIKSDSKLFFERIKVEFQNGDTRSLTFLSFIVI